MRGHADVKAGGMGKAGIAPGAKEGKHDKGGKISKPRQAKVNSDSRAGDFGLKALGLFLSLLQISNPTKFHSIHWIKIFHFRDTRPPNKLTFFPFDMPVPHLFRRPRACFRDP
jgi:hypothetical protein